MSTSDGSRIRRQPGEGSVYRAGDGRWHAAISLGRDQHGRRRRRHVHAPTLGEVEAKLAVLEAEAARPPVSVGEWSAWWLGMVERTLKQSTARTYGTNLSYLRPIAHLRLARRIRSLLWPDAEMVGAALRREASAG